MFEKLIELNDNIISKTSDLEKKQKHLLIKKILNDKQCFFKIDIETSFAILRELSIPDEKLKEVYSNLIDSSNCIL